MTLKLFIKVTFNPKKNDGNKTVYINIYLSKNYEINGRINLLTKNIKNILIKSFFYQRICNTVTFLVTSL
jgi:hypothetical protein